MTWFLYFSTLLDALECLCIVLLSLLCSGLLHVRRNTEWGAFNETGGYRSSGGRNWFLYEASFYRCWRIVSNILFAVIVCSSLRWLFWASSLWIWNFSIVLKWVIFFEFVILAWCVCFQRCIRVLLDVVRILNYGYCIGRIVCVHYTLCRNQCRFALHTLSRNLDMLICKHRFV
jgi:hypothetical protein